VYVVGGTPDSDPLKVDGSDAAWSLDLAAHDANWKRLPPLPGPGRAHTVAAVLSRELYVISGIRRVKADDGQFKLDYLKDAYRFSPASGRWSRIADLPQPNGSAPSPGLALDASRFVLLGGGARGERSDLPMQDRPGVARECIGYDAATDAWTPMTPPPVARLCAPVVAWDGGFAVIAGEPGPGLRSPDVWSVSVPQRPRGR
jgi:N-acetylneuraminic acid mutarotase